MGHCLAGATVREQDKLERFHSSLERDLDVRAGAFDFASRWVLLHTHEAQHAEINALPVDLRENRRYLANLTRGSGHD